jgi:hypothetical protein
MIVTDETSADDGSDLSAYSVTAIRITEITATTIKGINFFIQIIISPVKIIFNRF